MVKPKITLSELFELYPNLPKDTPFIVGIRGYYLNSMGTKGKNDFGIYDDAILLFDGAVLHTFNGNTDPSKFGVGDACIKSGVYPFYRGKHRGKYDALRPFPEGVKIPCTRDGKDSFAIATNMHKGGEISTGSEGCQTIPPSQWEAFIWNVYDTMNVHKMHTINYYLYEAKGS